jgi:hypothetical protein
MKSWGGVGVEGLNFNDQEFNKPFIDPELSSFLSHSLEIRLQRTEPRFFAETILSNPCGGQSLSC